MFALRAKFVIPVAADNGRSAFSSSQCVPSFLRLLLQLDMDSFTTYDRASMTQTKLTITPELSKQ